MEFIFIYGKELLTNSIKDNKGQEEVLASIILAKKETKEQLEKLNMQKENVLGMENLIVELRTKINDQEALIENSKDECCKLSNEREEIKNNFNELSIKVK